MVGRSERFSERIWASCTNLCGFHAYQSASTHSVARYELPTILTIRREVDQWLSDGKIVVQRKEIATLSNEILDMIFQAVLNDKREQPGHNLVDCVSLAVSCKRFLSVGKRRILRALVYFHGRDADCRLVCLGESTDPDDQAPPGMLTDAELNEIADSEAPKVLPVDTYDCDERNQPIAEVVAPRRLYSFAAAKYRSRATVTDIIQRSLRHRSREMDGRRKREGPCITASLTLDIHMITVLGCVEYCPHPAYPDGPNALCNTSKGEYILEDELVALKAKDDKINLAHALLSRIFYSSGSSISEAEDGEYANQLAKGPWAGDKFRIVPANKLPVLKGMKEWKDVTEEANNLLCHIWSVYDIAGEGYDTDSDVKEPEVRSTQLPLEAYFPYVCPIQSRAYGGNAYNPSTVSPRPPHRL